VAQKKDTWEKPRSHGTGLTADELAFVRQSFIEGARIDHVAKKLQCASRTVTKYYGYFRAGGVKQKPTVALGRKDGPARSLLDY